MIDEDGKKFPALVASCGSVRTQFLLPLEMQGDQVADMIADGIRKAYNAVRIANSGLVVGQLDLTKINLNGKDSDA